MGSYGGNRRNTLSVREDLPTRAPALNRVLADSLFDIPGGDGWSYYGERHDGNLEAMTPNGPVPGINGDVILMASDPYAVIARDTLHPGQALAPALVFDAGEAVRARLFVQSSLLLPAARMPVLLSVKLDGQVMAEAEITYGSVATIQGDFDLPPSARLILCFAQRDDIRHLVTLYSAALLDDGAPLGEPPTLTTATTVHPAWAELRTRLTASGVTLNEAALDVAIRNPLVPIPAQSIVADWQPVVADGAQFGAFREPNFFSTRRFFPRGEQ